MSNPGNPDGQAEASSLSTVGQIPMNTSYKRYLISGANAEKGDAHMVFKEAPYTQEFMQRPKINETRPDIREN